MRASGSSSTSAIRQYAVREPELVASPARLVAEGPVAEREPGDVADAIVVVDPARPRSRACGAAAARARAARCATSGSRAPGASGARPSSRPRVCAVTSRSVDLPRPPDRLDDARRSLRVAPGRRELVEADEHVALAHVAQAQAVAQLGAGEHRAGGVDADRLGGLQRHRPQLVQAHVHLVGDDPR